MRAGIISDNHCIHSPVVSWILSPWTKGIKGMVRRRGQAGAQVEQVQRVQPLSSPLAMPAMVAGALSGCPVFEVSA